MKSNWTSRKPINGLRHFVLVNKIKEKDQIKNLMVSVLDVEISLKISNMDISHLMIQKKELKKFLLIIIPYLIFLNFKLRKF